MRILDKFRHGKGTGQLYHIKCSLDHCTFKTPTVGSVLCDNDNSCHALEKCEGVENPLSMEDFTEWELRDIQPHIPAIHAIIRRMKIQDIVVKLRSKKSNEEHNPQNEFRVSERVSNINGFIRIIGVFDNPNVADDDINKHIVVMPYIHGGSLMQFQPTSYKVLKSLIIQATLSLAEAFLKYGFIHPCLHWCNVLLETTDDAEVSYEIGTGTITVMTHGHKVVITELNKAYTRVYEPSQFWYFLRRFYVGHLDIYRKQDTVRDWNSEMITSKYYEKTEPITHEDLTDIVELIQKSTFHYWDIQRGQCKN